MPTATAPLTERQLAGVLVETLRERLPTHWELRETPVESRLGKARPELMMDLLAPDGRRATLLIELKQVVEGRDVARLRGQLDTYAAQVVNSRAVVGARYLSPPTRARLVESGLSYVDATGNLRVDVSDPALFLSDRGSDSDPWRGPGRPRGTLKGAQAARVVRAITDFSGDWSARELIDVAGVSTGATYRVIDFLESEGLVERREKGVISVPSWKKVLRRWSEDYGFVRISRATRWIAPRGLGDLLERAATTRNTYAVTGTVAAAQWAAYAPARSAMIYVADTEAMAQEWGLRPAEAGANVMLGEPHFDVPFIRTLTTSTGLVVATPAQVVVDLMTGPGRNPAEAEELLAWMVANEQSWRS